MKSETIWFMHVFQPSKFLPYVYENGDKDCETENLNQLDSLNFLYPPVLLLKF